MKPLTAGFILDMMLGDPHSWPHPVKAMGKTIEKTEKTLRGRFPATENGEKAAGAVMAAAVPFFWWAVSYGILKAVKKRNKKAGWILESVMCYQLLAAKSLKDESMKVYDALKHQGLSEGRQAVSMIVGRDTENLTEEGVIKAAVETVAENTSDGVIGPLMFMALGGAPLGFFYKAVNTMDSMVGYRNEKYEFFGKGAARLDDVMNYIPSRLSALSMILASFLLRFRGKASFRIWVRDRRKHKSPNSAQTESVCAGALGVELAGDGVYFGKVVKKQVIGDNIRKIQLEDIKRANKLMYATAFIFLGAAGLWSKCFGNRTGKGI